MIYKASLATDISGTRSSLLAATGNKDEIKRKRERNTVE